MPLEINKNRLYRNSKKCQIELVEIDIFLNFELFSVTQTVQHFLRFKISI